MNSVCFHTKYCPLCASGKRDASLCTIKEKPIETMPLYQMLKAQCERLGITYINSRENT